MMASWPLHAAIIPPESPITAKARRTTMLWFNVVVLSGLYIMSSPHSMIVGNIFLTSWEQVWVDNHRCSSTYNYKATTVLYRAGASSVLEAPAFLGPDFSQLIEVFFFNYIWMLNFVATRWTPAPSIALPKIKAHSPQQIYDLRVAYAITLWWQLLSVTTFKWNFEV